MPPRAIVSMPSGSRERDRPDDPLFDPSLLTPHSSLGNCPNARPFGSPDILSDNEARAFVFGRGGSLEFPFPVAAKTGTSQAYRDNWTLGYTREVTVGVWVGNFDGAPMKNSSGVTGAGPIFHEVMLAAERRALGRMPGPLDPPIVDAPAGMTPVRICGLSGQKETAECPSGAQELLPVDEVPPVCRWHVREGGAVRTHWPPEYRSWAAGREASAVSAPSPGQTHRGAQFAIENPPEGAAYWIDPTLRARVSIARVQGPHDRSWIARGLESGRCTARRKARGSSPPVASEARRAQARRFGSRTATGPRFVSPVK